MNKTMKQTTQKRDDTPLHLAVRAQDLELALEILTKSEEKDLKELLCKQNHSGETALYVAAEYGHVDFVKAMIKYSEIAIAGIKARNGCDAFHVAAKQGNLEVVKILMDALPELSMTCDQSNTNHSEIASILQEYGVQNAKTMKLTPPAPSTAKELKQTVSDIKHEVHYQIEHTRQTRKHMKGIGKQINKMQLEGLNNAINSTTVVAVLIATVAFAGIFTVPGQYVDDPKDATHEKVLGEANIAPKPQFTIFLISDSIALFISLAVVVVQTSVVVVDKKGKKQMMAIINKLMWLACVSISVSFLALSFIVVGDDERWLAVGVTVTGTLILASTLGTMCYWVILNRIEASNLRSIRRSTRSSKSQSFSQHYAISDSENSNYKNLYAI